MIEGARADHLYQQHTDFEIIESLLPFLKNKSFIDIGAEKGSFTQFLSSHHLRGKFFEPLPKFASDLNALATQTRCDFYPFAISDRDYQADFYSAYDHDGNPMDYFSSLHPLNQDHRINHKKVARVDCRSLDSLLQEGLLQNPIGIVKIDTEGNDLNVLKGMTEIRCEILMCEYFMPGIYAGWEMGHPEGLIEAAKQLGFQHYVAIKRINEFEMIAIDSTAFMDQQWGNLIFICDSIFNSARAELDRIIANKEINLIKTFLASNHKLNETCEERLRLINRLDENLKSLIQDKTNTMDQETTDLFLHKMQELDEFNKAHYNKENMPNSMNEVLQVVNEVKRNLFKTELNYLTLQNNWVNFTTNLQKRIEHIEEDQNKVRDQYSAINQARLKVIEEQQKALAAYKLTRFKQRIKRFFKPHIGQLQHHAPRILHIPAHYQEKLTSSNLPTISIVTPSFNQGDYLEKTILSIIQQDYPGLEYVIQDGASTDSTVEVIQRYSKHLKYWESKADQGQSHALNLGFQHTSGEIMAYVNSDDLLLPGTLHYVAQYFDKHPNVDVVYGHRVLIDEYDNEVGRWILPPHDSKVLTWADYIPQETLFWRRRIWDRAGGTIDEEFKFAMDWDLLLRFKDAGAQFVRLPRFLGAFRIHTSQKTSAQMAQVGMKEMERLRIRCHGRPVSHLEVKKNIFPFMMKHVIFHKLYRVGILKY